MKDIPASILAQLNAGEIETVTLVEWLAIDQPTLLRTVLPKLGLGEHARELGGRADACAGLGIMQRIKGIGAVLHSAFAAHAKRAEILDAFFAQPSDMVRAWSVYAVMADGSLKLEERLKRCRRFAADGAMSVRECAWDSFRTYLALDLKRGFKLLEAWVRDRDPNVRRCAVEATRPRGVWCAHLESLKADPEPGLVLLEPVRADGSDYVRRSAANWLNDASKSQPAWVRAVCKRWLKESPTDETRWIVNHALRTLRKAEG